MSLPPPIHDQAYCDVSALEAGTLTLPLDLFITTAGPGDAERAPSLSFLIQHSKSEKKFILDLGIRKDSQNLPPHAYKAGQDIWVYDVPQDVVDSLAIGGLSPGDIDTICLSHIHNDHTGNTKQFPTSAFVVGAGCASLLEPGYPTDPNAHYFPDLLPRDRTTFLSSVDWPGIGPFNHASDFYGDGSLYLIDAAGHLPGHLNILARTSADGAWLYLAGDSAHHWSLITGESQIASGRVGGFENRCAHADKELAEDHIRRIGELMKEPRVRVLLAHDVPWYKENKDTSAFWPGKIQSL